jgi:hypothetical protein
VRYRVLRTGDYDMQEMEEDISNGIDFRSVNRAALHLKLVL